MDELTTFVAAHTVIIDVPKAHLVSEVPGVSKLANCYLGNLVDCAVVHVKQAVMEQHLANVYEVQVNDLGEVSDREKHVRRIVVHPKLRAGATSDAAPVQGQ